MRTALVAPQPFSDIRATPMMNLRITRMLADAGHTVDVITYPFGTAPNYPGVFVHRCPRVPLIRRVGIGFSPAKLLMDLRLAPFALKVGRTLDFDVIHAVEEAVFIGIQMGRRMGAPVIYDMDSVISHDIKASALGKISPAMALAQRAERWAIRHSDLVLTITPAMAEHVRKIDPQKRIVIVPDIPLPLPKGGLNPDYARKQLPSDFASAGQMVIYTGSTAKYQGLDMLIEAMSRVRTEFPDAALLVVGGENEDIRRLKEQSSTAGVMNNVLFLGKRPPEDIPHFLSAADVLVSPRRSGVNPPAKIYTYMQSGKPIVASDIPAHTAVLNQDTAVLTPATQDGLAEGILEVLKHPDEAFSKAARARKIVSDMTPEYQARLILEAYDLAARR